MIGLWIGTALLAGSWLFGLEYFYPASHWAWLVTVAAAVVLLSICPQIADSGPLSGHRRAPCDAWSVGRERGRVRGGSVKRWSATEAAALALLLPMIWFAPWPYRAAPLLLASGLILQLLPVHRPWSDRLACGSLTAGTVLLIQALGLELYTSFTAYSHALAWPLPDLLGGIAGLLGIDAAADGSCVVLHSMRQIHRLGATWELLLDPATWLFFVGGVTVLALHPSSFIPPPSAASRWSAWLSGIRWFTLLVLAWLPARAGLLMALYLHRVLRSDPNRPLHAMNHFFSPWILVLLLLAPVLLAWRLVRPSRASLEERNEGADPKGEGRRGEGECGEAPMTPLADPPLVPAAGPPPSALHLSLSAGLIALAVALFTAAIYWDPIGPRREGRVLVVERHSQWEPTTKPYDTTWFVEPRLFGEGSGYNYAAIYAYLGQFYQMSRLLESDKIDDQTLGKCDVLVIKIPTARYGKAEADAVVRFVERGGGLLLIGDHTNYEGSATAINDITRPMGFIYRDDLLFGFGDSPYEQAYRRARVPHPSVQDVPSMDFAVSCSIDPGHSRGRSIITSTGLWSMGPEYHGENYHPIPQHCPEMRYGAFVQAWAARHGQGRAIAWADSTIFSNFCVFQPGKAEMMLGMVEWLNHDNPPLNPRPWLLLLGVVPLVAGLWVCRFKMSAGWLLLLAAGTCGWVAASLAVAAVHHGALPAPECLRPESCVVIDRTTSNVPLGKGMYTRGDGDGYGVLESSIARLGCYTVRREADLFSGNALVVLCPSRSVSEEFSEELRVYVEQGGRLLVIDSPENTSSTVSSVLWPFGLSIHHDRALQGKLSSAAELPEVDVASANEVVGGEPLAKLDEHTVAAAVKYGKGSVMAVGFGSLWNDKSMGEHVPKEALSTSWMFEPNAAVKARYDLLFRLLRSWLEDKPLPTRPPAAKKGPAETGPQEIGPKQKEAPGLKEAGPADL